MVRVFCGVGGLCDAVSILCHGARNLLCSIDVEQSVYRGMGGGWGVRGVKATLYDLSYT